MKKMILFFTLLCAYTAVHAQTAWELKKDSEGIKVYAGSVANSNLKAIKVECTVNASLSQLAALLLDAKAHEIWVYNTKKSYVVKDLGPGHQVYYSEISMPWPLTNRDVVAELRITQHPVSKVMTVTANAVNNYVAKKDMVRVTFSKVNWTVTPVGNNKLTVVYIAEADPGGAVPAWAVNVFSAKGPFETFKKLKETVTLPAYRAAHHTFIKD